MHLAGDGVWTQPAATDAVGADPISLRTRYGTLCSQSVAGAISEEADDGCWGFRRDDRRLGSRGRAGSRSTSSTRCGGASTGCVCKPDAAGLAIVDLHLGHALCDRGRGCVVAVLGQSLDGYIATCDGDSRYINGPESLVHLHRVRALSDAVLVGVGTALADAPRLTTRHVAGPSATRVVLDPKGRLPATSGLLGDGLAPTIVVRATTDRAVEPPL